MAEYTGESSGFLSTSFEKVNDALASFASNYSNIIANEIAPLVALGLTLTFITVGVMAIRGLLDRPFMDVAWTLVKASIITGIALSSAVYQAYVIDPFLTLPDEMMGSISSSISGSSAIAGQGAAQAIERLYETGAYNAGLYFQEAGFTNPAPIVYGLLVLLGTILCVVVGALWLFIAKVILALMIGVGPFFICCYIWNPTQQFFWSWVGQILNAIITTIFVLAIFSIFSTIFQNNLNGLVVDDTTSNLMNASFYAFLGILCMGVLVAIPQYVSALTGAAGGAVGTAMSRVTGGAVNMGRGAAGAVGGAKGLGQKGYAGYKANQSYQTARTGGASRLSAARSARHTYNETKDDLKRGYPNYAKANLNRQSTVQGSGSYGGGVVPTVSFAKKK